MKRVTGMSGTGKSAVVSELALRGYRAVDLDTPEWSHWIVADPDDTLTPGTGRDWVWREERVRRLLSASREDHLFVSGCAENMRNLFDVIDTIVLLSAPLDTIMHRLEQRTVHGYGSTDRERARIAQLVRTVEPLLRRSAHYEIDTARPVDETVTILLTLVARA